MSCDRQCIVVTGVSSGIGFALLETLVTEGYFVFGSVRRQVDADRLSTKFKGSYSPLIFDVVDDAAVQKSAKQVPSLSLRPLNQNLRSHLLISADDETDSSCSIAVPTLRHFPLANMGGF